MNVVEVTQGDSPVILGQPHGGTHIPADIFARLTPRGQGLDDTDWHIQRLYDGLLAGATVVRSTLHRYVIDTNRDPDGASLYPGQNTTELCPTTDFDGEPLWQAGQAPSALEISTRRAAYHTPYHAAMAEQIARIKAKHGVVILFDCHSIRSHIPHLFTGQLPVFNTGTNNGQTCSHLVESAVHDICQSAENYSAILNGRFRGGWTTRHYGAPKNNTHAIQMELAQRAYTDERAPWEYHPARASKLRPYLAQMLHSLDHIARSGTLSP